MLKYDTFQLKLFTSKNLYKLKSGQSMRAVDESINAADVFYKVPGGWIFEKSIIVGDNNLVTNMEFIPHNKLLWLFYKLWNLL